MHKHSHKHKPKILFILRRRALSYPKINYYSSPGLDNSAKFVSDMLNDSGIESLVVDCVDNNGIDKLLHKHKPTHVVIEALWVVPVKFKILTRLHPKIKWVIRVHSDISFMASEGIAVDWLLQYLSYDNVSIGFNKDSTHEVFDKLYRTNGVDPEGRVIYLPNYYPTNFTKHNTFKDKEVIKIGCFGAVRPLKNQLIQAMAAVLYAQETGRRLEYHINGTRLEGQSEGILKNIRELFESLTAVATESGDPDRYKLVEHIWLTHEDFMNLVGQMDMGLQVSFSETFNIVAADFVASGIPVVTSDEISWVHYLFRANPTNLPDIIKKMYNAEFWKSHFGFIDLNKSGLRNFDRISRDHWISWIKA